MLTYEDIYKQHLAKALTLRANPNLSPSQKAKLTKRIRRLQDQLNYYTSECVDLPAELKEL